jgi:CRP-like cAMP-binding protein
MQAGCNMECAPGEPVLRPGDTDDRFYIVVAGRVCVRRGGELIGRVEAGGCFGEAAFAEGSRRDTVIEAEEPLRLLKVSATLLEQASVSCQLRFHKVFLRELIGRLQRGEHSRSAGG